MQNKIAFIQDNEVIEIDFNSSEEWSPTTTVLNYLRKQPHHKGVKEGCAEGDCGACTVVVAELNQSNKLTYKTINSCLVFLPQIHGKWLVTIEDIGTPEKLHPVQEALVETNGSQCGYCTPGIVMSSFGIYKNHSTVNRAIIEDALAGNLCRCTGYQSIIEAIEIAYQKQGADTFEQIEEKIIQKLQTINQKDTIELQTSKQLYLKPFNITEALRLRVQNQDALIVSGSTDIALRQTKKKELLKKIIDLSQVEEFKRFEENENEFVIGAATSLEQLKIKTCNKLQALHHMLSVFGSLQIRNSASIGGNIGSASPIGDTLPVLFAYRAKIKLISSDAERVVSIDDFILGYRQTALQSNELIAEVIIPKPSPAVFVKSYKISKRHDLDISIVSGGFRLELENSRVKDIILAYGGMAAYTMRAVEVEEFLKGKEWNEESILEAQRLLYNTFKPISDARSGEEYRKIVAKNLLMKFYLETVNKD